ncbi:hypothetical protein BLS_008533 [Venturia inaequalis]|uniref:SET domain-containing protein n=1 Tax=Venturia inaequalis TaxID=5025 RepID=A0A8H3VT50_VENIN|nr:hypothetical protein BLS_008533 [Venturia inaequalis]KAE9981880.1 hypothetical protein EG328_011336 [Venturia inaequalis]KAE9992374.1 hypothetical protein EG327_009209 [Venturia inaequalis]RDI81291.1 hypothetical protein Vi05172_g8766 [Venturia inaequalis]
MSKALLLSAVLIGSVTSTLPIPSSSPPPETISWQSPSHSCPGPPEPYTILPSPGKGLGVFALHDLDPGTIIMREPPILTIPRPPFKKGSGYPMPAISHLVRSAFTNLTPSQQSQITNLTFHASEPEKSQADVLGLIFRSNAYKTGDEIALFPKIARINHSCRPNTSYYWNAKLQRRIVYANRRIEKGEELSDSYISLLVTKDERRKSLEPYGFKCHCEACQTNTKASDTRRTKIKKTFTELDQASTLPLPAPPNPNTNPPSHNEAHKNAQKAAHLVSMLQAEGLADYYATAFRYAALFHMKIGEWGKAAKWANMGYELRVMEDPESAYAMEMFEITGECIEGWKEELRGRRVLKGEV